MRYRQPAQMHEAGDGTITYGAAAVEASKEFDVIQARRAQALRRLSPTDRRAYMTYLRTGRTPTTARARESHGSTNGRVRGSRRTNSRPNAPPSSDDPSEPPPPEGRLCENKRCEADISHLRKDAKYCDNDNVWKQQAYRDRQTVEHLDELVGTVAVGLSCTCSPKRNVVVGGVCFHCGHPRGAVTRDWLDDDMRARSFVSSHAPKRRNPRYGDRKRKPVREYVDREAVAA
jgi:hypothetical protein